MLLTSYYRLLRLSLCGLLMLLAFATSLGQEISSAKNLVGKTEDFYRKLPAEKIYLHTDKPAYAVTDTIWFQAYLLNAATLNPSQLSGKLYVELVNDSSEVVDRRVLPVVAGMAAGDFTLSEKTFTEGSYTLRAYTNWLKNFGENYFFHKQVYIGSNLSNDTWFLNEQHSINSSGGEKRAEINLNLHTLDNQPIANTNVTVSLLSAGRQLLKIPTATHPDGSIDLKVKIPATAGTKGLLVIINEAAGKHRLKLPIYNTEARQKTDLQFMPEGGQLVSGMLNKISFKAVAENGLGINIKGVIEDGRGQVIKQFAATYKGMGTFNFVPLPGEKYIGRIKHTDGASEVFALPAVQATGTVLRIDNLASPDSVYFYLTATGAAADSSQRNILLAHTLTGTQLAIPFNYIKGYKHIRLARHLLLAGIVNFSVVDPGGNVLNQRRIFNFSDSSRINISAVTSTPSYHPQDSITVNLFATDAVGKPLQGVFSIAVTDDSQVKTDTLQDNILSSMLLTSELKGYIEVPGLYFRSKTAQTARALDDLMLTQGWTGIDVPEMIKLANESVKFQADSVNDLSGTVKGFLNKPAKNLKLTLLANGTEVFVTDAWSNDEGRFVFNNLPLSDTVAYTIRATTKKGNTTAAVITLNEFKPPLVSYIPPTPIPTPWNISRDSTQINYFTNKKKETERINMHGAPGKILNEVVIKGVRPLSFKGVYGEDIYRVDALIEEEAFKKAGTMSLYDYLRTKVDGFAVVQSARPYMKMSGHVIAGIFIDGISVNKFIRQPTPYDPPDLYFQSIKAFLMSSVADVTRVWIKHYPMPRGKIVSFMMIQTRSKSGPTFQSAVNNYVYRPLPVYTARNFYQPKYAPGSPPNLSDLRSTIHWEPQLVTDSTGRAKFTFYAAGKPATYTVNIQGTDMNGRFGVYTFKIKADNASTLKSP